MELKAIGNMVLLILVMVVFIGGIVSLTPGSAMAKVRDAVDKTVDSWLSGIKSEKLKEKEQVPDDIKKVFDSLTNSFRKNGDKCLIEHPDFSSLGGYTIEIENLPTILNFKLMKDNNLIDDEKVSGKKVCVIAGSESNENVAENFFEYYNLGKGLVECCVCENECSGNNKCEIKKIASSQTCAHYFGPMGLSPSMTLHNCDTSLCKKPAKSNKLYTVPSSVKLSKSSIDFGAFKGISIEDNNLMFVDGKNICLFPTYSYGYKWGCDADKGGLDNDCIESLKEGKIINFCEAKTKEPADKEKENPVDNKEEKPSCCSDCSACNIDECVKCDECSLESGELDSQCKSNNEFGA